MCSGRQSINAPVSASARTGIECASSLRGLLSTISAKMCPKLIFHSVADCCHWARYRHARALKRTADEDFAISNSCFKLGGGNDPAQPGYYLLQFKLPISSQPVTGGDLVSPGHHVPRVASARQLVLEIRSIPSLPCLTMGRRPPGLVPRYGRG